MKNKEINLITKYKELRGNYMKLKSDISGCKFKTDDKMLDLMRRNNKLATEIKDLVVDTFNLRPVSFNIYYIGDNGISFTLKERFDRNAVKVVISRYKCPICGKEVIENEFSFQCIDFNKSKCQFIRFKENCEVKDNEIIIENYSTYIKELSSRQSKYNDLSFKYLYIDDYDDIVEARLILKF